MGPLAGDDKALLVRRDILLVLELGLHIVGCVPGLHVERSGLAGQGLDKDYLLHRDVGFGSPDSFYIASY